MFVMEGKLSIIRNLFLSRIKNVPYKLNLAVTFQCTSRCQTCNIWKKYRDNPELKKDELTLLEIDTLFKNLPSTMTWVSLTGGDPFLRPDLPQIIKSAAENIPSLQIISIPSNGLLKDRILSVIEEMMEYNLPNIFITFSIDGPPEIHDKIRGINGAFQKAWDTYTEVKKLTACNRKFHVGLETTLSRWNIDSIKHFLLEMDGHSTTITVAHNAYLYDNQEDVEISPHYHIRHTAEVIGILKDQLSFTHPNELIEKIYLQSIPAYLDNKTRQVIPCVALKASLAVNAYGDVTPCFMWGKKIGNVRDCDYDIMSIWNSKEAELAKSSIKENKCANCWTPCEAYQSIIWHPLRAIASYCREI